MCSSRSSIAGLKDIVQDRRRLEVAIAFYNFMVEIGWIDVSHFLR